MDVVVRRRKKTLDSTCASMGCRCGCMCEYSSVHAVSDSSRSPSAPSSEVEADRPAVKAFSAALSFSLSLSLATLAVFSLARSSLHLSTLARTRRLNANFKLV